ncbi:MAG: tRNA dihydrouridine synthase DusB [Candidatus Zixiibacteriota bacterium]
MQIGNLNIKGRLFLAPLAGISNRPFRLLARQFGAAVTFTEMISVDAVIRGQKKTLNMVDLGEDEHPVGVQLFGCNPEYVAGAVKKVVKMGADIIDLNLGCPVRKVIQKNGGAALLKNLPLAKELMQAAVENSSVPVMIKIRTGWTAEEEVFIEMGKIAEDCGVKAVTLHPRSRNQNYSILSDWSKIAELKKELSIPVIGNGDIENGEDARRMLDETGCDAVMVGRAAMKNPFVLRQISKYLETGEIIPDLTLSEKIEMALMQARLTIDYFGENLGIKKIRKHLLWYTKGFHEGGSLRHQLIAVKKYSDIQKLFSEYLGNHNI